MRSKSALPLLVPFVAIASALGVGAWTGFPIGSDAFLDLLERELGRGVLAANHPDRPLYGRILQATVNLTGFGPAVAVISAIAAWSLLAWLTSLLWKRLRPDDAGWSWLPALLVLSPIVCQVQFMSLTIVYPCVVPVALALAALLIALGGPSAFAAIAILLLSFLAALISEYGVAAALSGVILALAQRHPRRAALLALGAGLGTTLLRLTADLSGRPDITGAVQLPKVMARPLRLLLEQWLLGLWHTTVGAYVDAARRVDLDLGSGSTTIALVLGFGSAVLVFRAVRSSGAPAPRALEPRRAGALLLAIGAAIFPVLLAGRPVAFHALRIYGFDTRFLLPALPFACLFTAGALLRVVSAEARPAAVALVAFLCVETAWLSAGEVRRAQLWAQSLGRIVRPLVAGSPGISIFVVDSDPSRRGGPSLTSKVTLDWPVEEERRVWVLERNEGVELFGPRRACQVGQSIRLAHELRSVERVGPLAQVVWVPDKGETPGEPEPYCKNSVTP